MLFTSVRDIWEKKMWLMLGGYAIMEDGTVKRVGNYAKRIKDFCIQEMMGSRRWRSLFLDDHFVLGMGSSNKKW
jgi:hypothetical protein